MSWVELTPPTTLANLLQIDWVEQGTGGQEMVVSYWSGSKEHTINYGTAAAALVAIAEWLAFITPPPFTGVKIGDRVIIHVAPEMEALWGSTIDAVILHVSTQQDPYWSFRNTLTDLEFCWDQQIRMELNAPVGPPV